MRDEMKVAEIVQLRNGGIAPYPIVFSAENHIKDIAKNQPDILKEVVRKVAFAKENGNGNELFITKRVADVLVIAEFVDANIERSGKLTAKGQELIKVRLNKYESDIFDSLAVYEGNEIKALKSPVADGETK